MTARSTGTPSGQPGGAPRLDDRALLANVSGMVFRAHAESPWTVLYASEGIESLTGHKAAWFVDEGRPWRTVMCEDDVERVSKELAAQAAAGQPMRAEYRIRHRDGTVRWVEGRARLVEGQPGLFDGTVYDIDERKRAELALRESQAHFRFMAQTVPGVLWTARADGSLNFVSDAALRELGAPPGQLVDHGWLDRVHPDDVAATVERWIGCLQTGSAYVAQFRLRGADGAYRTYEARALCRRDEDHGPIVRWYGILTNIDHLIHVEDQLRESEARLRSTIQASPGLTFSARADGVVDFQSDASRRLFGLEPSALVGDSWHEHVHPDHLERIVGAWQHSITTGTPFQIEVPVRSAHGGHRWFSLQAIPDRDADGRIVRWYGTGTDIDEFKRALATAESASRAKSAFLSTMSHEIRTPLTAVLGFAGLLADTELSHQQRDFVNSIRASGDHLLGVINDILDFSKLESGSLSLEFAPCDLRQTVESALDLVASQAAAKHLELVCRIDDDVPPACIADQARLRQVLANLLSNAVKFTLEGEVFVWVCATPLGTGEFEFEFRVTDTGIGIAADRLDRLFRDFSQVDDSVARRFGGTGLGLAISKRLVEAHGGVMSVDSRPGRGSTFTFRIPAQAAQAPGAAPTASIETLRSRRVLLVDDNRSNLDILVLQVQAWDMDPVAVIDPSQVVEVVERAQARDRGFDVAILDHRMSPLDGLELAKRLRSVSPVPIILLTSLGTTLQAARESGADIAAVQPKPIHRSALLETLSALLAPTATSAVATPRAKPSAPRLRLLLVEDNLANRKVAQLLLRKIGYQEIDVAVDGLEAVDAAKARDYDVILMDVQMPNLDGLDATRRIRAELPADRQPQIIAMTANAMVEDRETCIAAGMDDYLAKPIVPEHLTQALLAAGERRGVVAERTTPKKRTSERREAEQRARRISEQVLAGGGEMGELMRRIDWSETPLGPPYTWPQSLRTALSILLTQKHPIFLWWGRELVQFYNDAYRQILGPEKHPRAMGMRGRECWKEIWDVVGPMADAVMYRGESTMVERGLLCMDRNGLLEEGYFTYGYSPIRDETGGIGGIFVACSENTVDVIATRRSELLLDLAARLEQAPDREVLWRLAEHALDRVRNDLPFVLVYAACGGDAPRRVVATGLPPGHDAAPAALDGPDQPWPDLVHATSPEPQLIEKLSGRLPPLAPWPEPPDRAFVHPLADGMIVMGLSPRLRFDAPYRQFCERLALALDRALEAIDRRT